MGQITFGGLASGLDTNAIIEAIVQLERRPIEQLQAQRGEERTKLNLFGTLEGLVKALQTKAKALQSDFYAYDLTTSSESTASFTLSSGAQSGSHTLAVNSLAAADRYTFAAVTDLEESLGAGTITFDYESDDDEGQESFTVTISDGADTIEDIATAINSQAGDAVTASVINVGTTVDPSYQLVIAGNDTGADYTIDNLAVTSTNLTVESNVTQASNAQVVLDGITIDRSTNVFSDVLDGVSFTVSEQTTAAVNFTVNADPEGIKSNVQEFVKAYNAVIDFINEQNEYDPETGPGGALFGESAMRTVRSTIQSALLDVDINAVTADEDGYSTLALVGIDLDSDGRLSIDDSTFDEKLSDNLELFASLFLNDDDDEDGIDEEGVLLRLEDAIDSMISDGYAEDSEGNQILDAQGDPIPVSGLFNSQRKSINQILRDMDKEVDRLERKVSETEEELILRFAKLEEVMSGLTAQSQYLAFGLGVS